MKQNVIRDLPNLRTENYENIFNVYQTEEGLYYYNLLNTVVFPSDLPANVFTTYVVKHGDTWPFISYKNYKTPNLWWLILLANKIDNPLRELTPGTSLLIPVELIVREILSQISR